MTPRTAFAPSSDDLPRLLASGGDARLNLDPATQLNGYGCRPYPRPEAFTFASSTATSISERGYAAAEAACLALERRSRTVGAWQAFDEAAETLRDDLKALLDLGDAELVFSPSGTDSQLHALFIAQTLFGGPVVNILAAADETGSGALQACTGRHFNATTALGAEVTKGAVIEGLIPGHTAVAVPIRNGLVLRDRKAADADVLEHVARAVAAGARVLLHVMDYSKLGSVAPSAEVLESIEDRWPEQVLVVVDACQTRLSRRRLGRHLARGRMVLLTGSKFFTGPPFSGALAAPKSITARMALCPGAPLGLRAYTTASDWPRTWLGVRAWLPRQGNLGQLLRWTAARAEMEAYFAVPFRWRRAALARFSKGVKALIDDCAALRLLPCPPQDKIPGINDEEMSARTVFPFLIQHDGAPLSLEDCGLIYRALNRDVSPLLGPGAVPEDRVIAAQLCHIGQPVALRAEDGRTVGALRLSAGARVATDTWTAAGDADCKRALETELDQIRAILAKLALLVGHLDALRGAEASA